MVEMRNVTTKNICTHNVLTYFINPNIHYHTANVSTVPTSASLISHHALVYHVLMETAAVDSTQHASKVSNKVHNNVVLTVLCTILGICCHQRWGYILLDYTSTY